MPYLLDTNVVSELRKERSDPRVAGWAAARPIGQTWISVVTIAEIRFGIERAADDRFRDELTEWLEGALLPRYRDRILDVDEGAILESLRLSASGRARSRTFAYPDVLLAAQAALRGLTIATRNVAHFRIMGVATFNPWIAEGP